MKRVVIFFLCFSFILSSVGPVFAQEATQSATPSATLEPLPSPTPEPTPTPPISLPEIITDNLQPTTDNQISSAQIRKKTLLKRLSRKNFQIDEQIAIDIENTYDSPVEVAILDFDNQPVALPIHTEKIGDSTRVSVLPSYQITPGKYQLRITAGGITQVQDFIWGVLAINPDKAIYLPGESAFISMAILNEKGVMVCNANVTLDIKGPSGVIHTLSTFLGTVKINPECNIRDLTIKPDYEATFINTSEEGNYELRLEAETPNGTYNITDHFTVQAKTNFDIQRTGPTRIFPIKAYPMQAKIKFNSDFSGKIVETVPASFTISPMADSIPYTEVTTEQLSTVDTPQLALIPPLTGDFPITQGFGQSLTDSELASFYQSFGMSAHDGIDYSVPENLPVSTVDDGKVIQSGNGAYGITVVVEHTWGRSYYGHLNQNQIQVGQTVKKGDIVGLSGKTGITTGPHLHFGIRPKDYNIFNGYFGKVDPLPYLSSHIQNTQSVKKIAWDITAAAGETISLGYQFDAPEVSPEFYLTGPLKFYTGVTEIPETEIDLSSDNPFVLGTTTSAANLVFEENRQWQIAADADIVIEASINTANLRHKNKKNMVFTTDQIGYAFWTETTTQCHYSKTTDGGATWSGSTSVSTTLDATGCLIWYDRWTPGDVTGNYIHILIADNGNDEFYYERIDTANSDTQMGEIDITTTNGTALTNTDGYTFTKGTDGYLYAAYTTSQTGFSEILRCTGSCDSAGNWSAMTDNFDDAQRDWIQMTPLLGGKILLVRQDISADDIDYDVLTSTTWAGFVDIDTDVVESSDPSVINFGVVTRLDTGYVYLTYIPNQATDDTSEVRTQIYDGSSWTAKTDCLADTEPSTTEMVIFTDPAIDIETGDIYCAYTYGDTNAVQNIYYKKSTDGMTTWGSQAQLNTSHTGDDIKHLQLNGVSGERIYFNYLFNSTTDTREGATVVDLVPPPPDELMRHGMWFTKAGAKMQFSF